MRKITRYISVLFLLLSSHALAQNELPYLCEIGLQGGIGYYVGEATPHIFMHPREAYGVQFRYKFTKRWAMQLKVSGQRIVGHSTPFENRLYNVDLIAEYNFFRFGSEKNYDDRIKPYTPYIFLGIGTGMNHNNDTANYGPQRFLWNSMYIPFGIGFKWKFHDRLGLNIAWQHNIYFADNVEGIKALDNPNGLNGWNIMNMDLTGMLTVALVVELGQAKKPCRVCNE